MLNAADVMLAMLPLALLGILGRNGLATNASQPGLIAESQSNRWDWGAQVRCKAEGRVAAMIKRRRAAREQKRCEIKEYRAWLQITAHPLW
jgi:hypothetical protein